MIFIKRILLFLYCFFLFILLCVFKIKAENIQYIIYIDPGHGGRDGGCEYGAVKEKTINLEISLLLKCILEENGFEVQMTRNSDCDLSTENSKNHKREDIHKRVDMINQSPCLLYLSIHMNSGPNRSYHGAQVFYSKQNSLSKFLASCIQEQIKQECKNTKRKEKPLENIYLLENVEKPGCLIECGFLSNSEERDLLQTKEYQEKLSNAIFYGVLQYINMV